MASYQSTASGGLLSSNGLLLAEQWLVEQGWLTREGATVTASVRSRALPKDNETEVARDLLRATILDAPPAWLNAAAAQGEVRPEFLPVEVERVLADMFDAQERDAILLAAAAKYDDAALRALGEAGEEAVLAACRAFLEERNRADLAREARRVSLISDALGYDIWAPDLAGARVPARGEVLPRTQPWRLHHAQRVRSRVEAASVVPGVVPVDGYVRTRGCRVDYADSVARTNAG